MRRVTKVVNDAFALAKILDKTGYHLLWYVFRWKFFGAKEYEIKLAFQMKLISFFVTNRVDLAMLKEIYIDNEYAFNYVSDPKIILDLGANMGDTAIYYSILFPKAKIYAIEPNPYILAKLEKNIKPFNNIVIRRCAISNFTSKMPLFFGKSHAGSSLKIRKTNPEAVEVDVFSLEDFCKRESISRIDILKFDIEGAEEDMLRSSFIQTNVNEIVGEMHDDLVTKPLMEQIKTFRIEHMETHVLSKYRYILYAQLSSLRSKE